MLKKHFIGIKEVIIVIIFLFFSSNVVLAKKTVDANTIINAFFEFSILNRYSDTEIQDKLEKIIEGKETFSGKKWDEFLEKTSNMQKKGGVYKNEASENTFFALSIIQRTVGALYNIEAKKISDTISQKLKMINEKLPVVIPKDLNFFKKYLAYATDISLANYEIFKNDQNSEDFSKMQASLARRIDLYEKIQDAGCELVESLGGSNQEEKAKKYVKTKYEYEIEDIKQYIYQLQKERIMGNNFSLGENVYKEQGQLIEKCMDKLKQKEQEYENMR